MTHIANHCDRRHGLEDRLDISLPLLHFSAKRANLHCPYFSRASRTAFLPIGLRSLSSNPGSGPLAYTLGGR